MFRNGKTVSRISVKVKKMNLLELMIAIAIIGILSILSLPIYTQHLVHEKRIEAEIMLEKLSLALEHYYIIHNSYKGATFALLKFPERIVKNNYQLALRVTESDFTITAHPLAAQAEKDTNCAALSLNSLNQKTISGTGSINECW